MKRISTDRHLTADEAAEYNLVREQVKRDFPPLPNPQEPPVLKLTIRTTNAGPEYQAMATPASGETWEVVECGGSPDEAVGAVIRQLELTNTFKEPVVLSIEYNHK